jgi:hypothetical protein
VITTSPRGPRPRTQAARRPTQVASIPTLERAPGRRGEEFVALLCLALALGADLVLIRVGLDSQDEGYFVEQATRVVQGQLPYRDFDSLYTPALLYLHAAVFSLFGGSPVIDVRIVGLVGRLLLTVALYLLCRPLVRPAIAVLPSLYILFGLDRLPSTWEPHPGWPSAALTVVAAWAYTRLPTLSGHRRVTLLVAIGAVTGLVFAFKQNAGVLLGLALVVSTAWQGIEGTRTDVTRALRVLQLLLLLVVLAAAAWLIHPHLSPSILAYFLIPLLAAGLAALRPVRVSAVGRRAGSWFALLGWLGLGWSLVSLPWLIALLAALNWNVVLLKGFIGLVNQDVLWSPLELPTGGGWASLLGIAVGLLAMVHFRRRPLLCAGAFILVLAFAVSTVLLTGETAESAPLALVLAPGRAAAGFALLLPVVSIVAGAILSLRPLPSSRAWLLRWMTVASALTFLTQYPRVDQVHLTWSACLPLATGAVVLAHLYTFLTRRWDATGASRFVVACALVVVPIATVMLNMGTRSDGFVVLGDDSGRLAVQLAPTITLSSPLAVAGTTVVEDQARTLVATAQFIAANTVPGEPIFVYPTAPLMYVLANRPNPTRFAHLYPGAASPTELDTVIATLDKTPVNFVVVSESELEYWGPPGQNARLETYLVANYDEIAQFGEYRLLHRK